MKIIAINGSHRKGKNTARLLEIVLEAAKEQGAETELLEITDLNIKPCTSCNKCFFKPECSIKNDDMAELYEKLKEADGIILGSPVYFSNVTGRLKDFIDRSRPLHMTANHLEGKVGGAVVVAGLRNGGQEITLQILHNFLASHGLFTVGNRQGNEAIINGGSTAEGAVATMFEGYSENKMSFYRSVTGDKLAVESCRRLGLNMVSLLKRLKS